MLFKGAHVAELRETLAEADRIILADDKLCRKMGRELAELRAFKSRVLAGLQRANAKRKAERLAKEAADTALRNKVNAERRVLVGEVI